MTTFLRSALGGLVSTNTLLPEDQCARWCSGGSAPAAVVAPSSAEELGEIMALASREGWRVVPAGKGTWLRGGGKVEADLVISTVRMVSIREYEPADLTFTAEAGITLSVLGEATAANGQWLPIDPPGGGKGSLGAAVSLGVGGPLGQLYGTPRDQILGLSMVSGDGRILNWGGRVVKNVAGFDLTRLTIGSWGTLGIITSVSARLFPIPEADVTLALKGPEASSLLPAADSMIRSGLPIAAMEVLDPLSGAEAGPEAGAGLALRLLGSRAQVEEMESRIRAELAGMGTGWTRVEGDESRSFQDGLSDWEEGADMVLRLALFPSQLGSLFQELAELLDGRGGIRAPSDPVIKTSTAVGPGVLRVAFSGVPTQGTQLENWVVALVGLRDRLEGGGGSLTLSTAPESLMEQVGAWGSVGGEAAIMRGIKEQFDPQGVLAPGRFVV